MSLPSWLTQHLAALRAVLVLTVVCGVIYPLAVTALVQLPGLRDRAAGSLVRDEAGAVVGSTLIGQSFSDAQGNPLQQYLQSRPSAAGSAGYDPTASGASNLGPSSVVDTLPDPTDASDSGHLSLLSQVCSRSLAVATLEGVDGSRPYCTVDGVGAVLAVFRTAGRTGSVTRAVSLDQACPAAPFLARFEGVAVECARFGADYSRGVLTPVRGAAPASPTVPADAVTASGSGLDPAISPDYARLQAPRVARARGVDVGQVLQLIRADTTEPLLGFLGEPAVNVLVLNLDLDRLHPYRH